MDKTKKEAMLRNTADSLTLQRVGIPIDMGESIYFLLTASFCTGVGLIVMVGIIFANIQTRVQTLFGKGIYNFKIHQCS